MTDHRNRPRRRGEALNSAILEATLAELNASGYRDLTMERVADRARASKATLYRRWSSRAELVMAAVYHHLPNPDQPPDTGSFRTDVLALVHQVATQLAGPAGAAMRGLIAELLTDPQRAEEIQRHAHGAGARAMREIARRAAERGELEPTAVTTRRLELPQAMVRNHFLFNGLPPAEETLVSIVDELVLPAFGVGTQADALLRD